jgi:hypothetical protein
MEATIAFYPLTRQMLEFLPSCAQWPHADSSKPLSGGGFAAQILANTTIRILSLTEPLATHSLVQWPIH